MLIYCSVSFLFETYVVSCFINCSWEKVTISPFQNRHLMFLYYISFLFAACSTVLVPARVAQALNLKLDEDMVGGHLQDQSRFNGVPNMDNGA